MAKRKPMAIFIVTTPNDMFTEEVAYPTLDAASQARLSCPPGYGQISRVELELPIYKGEDPVWALCCLFNRDGYAETVTIIKRAIPKRGATNG